MAGILSVRMKSTPHRARAHAIDWRESQRLLNRLLLAAAYVACVAVFLWGVSLRWQPAVGFTSLIGFGAKIDARCLDKLRNIPHAVDSKSTGYDGQFYAQLALSPALDDPQLAEALDNKGYRSRRILFSWTAWAMGLGRPAWVIEAYALQNVLFWLGAAVLLLRWLPPTRWFHFFQWAAILFSRGWMESVSWSLLDGPALFLTLLGVWLSDRRRPYWGTALVGLSALGKETNLLAGLALLPEFRCNAKGAKDAAIRGLLLILPIVLWLAAVSFRFGMGGSAGMANFAVPLGGWVYKSVEFMMNADGIGWSLRAFTVMCLFSTIVQIGWHFASRQWTAKWWRLGAPYAILGICLGPAVMEGYPGASSRVLLPLLAAFNLSLKPTKMGWLLLAIGNFGVLPGLYSLGLADFLAFLHPPGAYSVVPAP
jgi:hypothetical protein